MLAEYVEDNVSPDQRERIDAAPLATLGRDAGPLLVALLTPAQTDDSYERSRPDHLVKVIDALAAIGYAEAVADIEPYSGDRRPEVALAANNALARLKK